MTAVEKKLEEHEDEMDSLEQQGRKASIRVFGIPEVADETAAQLKSSVLSVLQDKLQLNTIAEQDLEVIHRCGTMQQQQERARAVGAAEPKPRSVIVKFHHREKRAECFKRGVLGRLKNTGIVVAEDLSRRRSAIAFECRQKIRDKKLKECWTTNGKVLVKDNAGTIKMVTSLSQAKAF